MPFKLAVVIDLDLFPCHYFINSVIGRIKKEKSPIQEQGQLASDKISIIVVRRKRCDRFVFVRRVMLFVRFSAATAKQQRRA